MSAADAELNGPTVWEQLVGQQLVVEQLQSSASAAVRARTCGQQQPASPSALSSAPSSESGGVHTSWLFTGPAGSGRSVAARAFAAALECDHAAAQPTGAESNSATGSGPAPGCGHCAGCRRVLGSSSPDLRVVATQTLSHSVADMRQVVADAARTPSVGRWQIILIEDADRLTEQAANALLKAVEEPHRHTWWLLCAPTADDVLPTIRSRCRLVRLRTPSPAQVAQVLIERDGVEPAIALLAARSADGHVGRARWLARDEQARTEHAATWAIPGQLGTVSDCLKAAAQMVQTAQQAAQLRNSEHSEREREHLAQALGVPTDGQRGVKVSRQASATLREQEKIAKAREKRVQRDVIDQMLTQLSRCYRDVLAWQWGAPVGVMAPVPEPETGAVAGPVAGAAVGEGNQGRSAPAGTGAQVVAPDELNAAVQAVESGQRHIVAQLARTSSPHQSLQRLEAIVQARTAIESNVAPLLALEVLMLQLSPSQWLTPTDMPDQQIGLQDGQQNGQQNGQAGAVASLRGQLRQGQRETVS